MQFLAIAENYDTIRWSV